MTRLTRLLLLVGIAMFVHAGPARAADIRAYDVRLTMAADGTGTVTADVSLERAAPGEIAIPLGFSGITAIHVDGPPGVTATCEPVNGQSLARVVLPTDVQNGVRLRLTFDLPMALERTDPAPGERATLAAGTRMFKHVLLNTQVSAIGRYQFTVIFPTDARAHAVRESSPKLRTSEPGPRVRLDNIDGRAGARLTVDRLQQGDTASVLIELVPRSRSLTWLIAGVLLSVAYLVVFRDLVARPRTPAAPAPVAGQ